MAEYDRDIDAECKKMWDAVMFEKMKTTSTKVRAIVDKTFGKRVLAVEEKVNEHDGILSAFKRGFLGIVNTIDPKRK